MGTCQERLGRTGIQMQRVRKLMNRVRIRRPTNAPLQIGDTPPAEPSTFGELLLREPRQKAEVP